MLAVLCVYVCVTNKGVSDQQTVKKKKKKRKTGQGRMLSEEGVAKKKIVGGRHGREWRPELGRGVLLMISPPAVGLGRSRRRERRRRK